jgi:hypothetical protein
MIIFATIYYTKFKIITEVLVGHNQATWNSIARNYEYSRRVYS